MSPLSRKVLGHEVGEIHARWQAVAAGLAAGAPVVVPDLTQPVEYSRSPAAARIGELAAADGLFHFHFERRLHLPLPEAWAPAAEPELAQAPLWDAGILPEAKYQSFRHDLQIASFHPHHRAKWSTHELCHGLVGFAWRADATPFFHATAGRLAEILPVALWYFFDEAFLRRCDDHAGEGDTFRIPCPRCEAMASADPTRPEAADFIEQGLRFVEAELAAVARSRRLGRAVPHRWATIDLASDGVAYGRAHAARLSSEAFHTYAERFLVADGGWSEDLDALEARVLDVVAGLVGPERCAAMAPTADHGRWRWMTQDLGWRALASTTDGPPAVRRAGLAAADTLAEIIPHTLRRTSAVDTLAPPILDQAVRAWRAVRSKALPTIEDVLSVGYAVPGHAPAQTTLLEGLDGCVPIVRELLGDLFPAEVEAFARDDGFTRAHLAVRWGAWVAAKHPGAIGDLATWESAVATLTPHASANLDGPAADDRRRLADGMQVLRFSHEVLSLAERAEAGGLDAVRAADGSLSLIAHDGLPVEPAPTAILLGRDAAGEALVLDIDPAAADALSALGDGVVPDLPADELDALTEFGVLVPVALRESHN